MSRYVSASILLMLGILHSRLVCTAEDKSPLKPQDELASFELADESLHIELVVSEPNIVSPVAIAWDAGGAMYVAEMHGYPATPKSGKIKRLEDRDGDGTYEAVSVFAEGLDFPTGVMPYRNGILVTAAPDILFLQDTDRDGVADKKEVLWTGFRTGNQQLRVNGLYWGIDNWIYGANGRSGGAIRHGSDAKVEKVSINQRDFRFHPDNNRFESLMGMSQFGLAHDDWGNRFISWNHRFARQVLLEGKHIERNPRLITQAIHDTAPPDDDRRVYFRGAEKPVFNRDPGGYFTSLSGLTIFRGDALGEEYSGDAFAGESAQAAVVHRRVNSNGPLFVTERGRRETEFIASTDSWFHPVNFATGPDGALYIVDFYRQLVEHPQWASAQKSKGVDWQIGAQHGRIWRVRKKSLDRRSDSPKRLALDTASPEELVESLSHPVGWWRDTAQRLIVERQNRKLVPLIRPLLKSNSPLARLHAMWTLRGLHSFSDHDLIRSLHDDEPRIRVHAVRIAEMRFDQKTLRDAVLSLITDDDQRVKFEVALALGSMPPSESLRAIASLARTNAQSSGSIPQKVSPTKSHPAITLALLSSSSPIADELLADWLTDSQPTQHTNDLQFTRQLGRLAANHIANDSASIANWIHSLKLNPEKSLSHFSAMVGVAEGLADRQQTVRSLFADDQFAACLEDWKAAFDRAEKLSKDSRLSLPTRLMAAEFLSHGPPDMVASKLFTVAQMATNIELRLGGVRAIADLNDSRSSQRLFADLNQFDATVRREILLASLRSHATAAALLKAIRDEQVFANEVPEDVRLGLMKLPNVKLREVAVSLLSSSVSEDRHSIVEKYKSAFDLAGRRDQGAQVFKQNCINCHSIAGKGASTGPDLSRIKTRSDEAILVSILDPSREVSYELKTYIVLTVDGKVVTGFIESDTPSALSIRTADGKVTTVDRDHIEEQSATGKSIMPEGLERNIDEQAMADLLAFLKNPDDALLKVKSKE